ncbi:MAG TPA: DNA replication complex GINS family protein [Methanothermococcus okinawensis]|uniref:DNA replication complex GINS family protein n=1 Tax=Methanothermococcus okinawensis TaxID=155863 RepID=A0A832YSH5_9EURY|nr:DNA replication complex GINS family protein [Methanothermococcus okinawensis]
MYEKIANIFFNELKNDDLLKLPENFYDEIREYINNDEYKDEREIKRIKYYAIEIRKLRIYKALYNSKENLINEEKNILKSIENIEGYGEDGGSTATINHNNDSILEMGNILNNQQSISEIQEKETTQQIPKLINTQRYIDIVRVLTKFPEFTDGKYTYNLNREDIVSLDKRISKILEKHKIVKKIAGDYNEDEKKDKEILPLL